MSNLEPPQPGWWKASDGEWYPPEQHPGYGTSTQATSMMSPGTVGAAIAGSGEEARYTVNSPYKVANWRPLVHWAMVIPHYIVGYVLQIVSGIGFFISWWALLFTGKIPDGLYNMMTMSPRYGSRWQSFYYGFSEIYPPFDVSTGAVDNGAYPPVRVDFPPNTPTVPRKRLANFFLAIPHFIVLGIFGIGAAISAIIAWFAVLFTGAWPQGLRDFNVRFWQYATRVTGYVLMMTDKYPAFGLG